MLTIDRLGSSIFPKETIRQQILGVRNIAMSILNPTNFLSIVFSTRLLGITEVVDYKTIERYGTAEFIVFIKEPNWDAEEKIYEAYQDFLNEAPNAPDLRVIDLLDRTVDESLEQL
jgi:hypothetical protein